MGKNDEDWVKIRDKFRQIWGYEEFRPPQAEIIQSLLTGRDTVIVMPTGAGKSLCFQLPALIHSGLTVVVSPLVALMEDQVRKLQQRHIAAETLHSEIPRARRKQILAAIAAQKLRLLYLSPESLFSVKVWQCLSAPDIKINGLIVDEAHCLVQWGASFRPHYQRLGVLRPAIMARKPTGTRFAIAAFTATADIKTRQAINSTLQLNHPQQFFLAPYRANLNLAVEIAWTPRCRREKLWHFIQKRPGKLGIVYVRSRRDCESLAGWLMSRDFSTCAYHAGLSPQERRSIEQQWLSEKIGAVVCTSAFGLGIDKANVRWVVHFHPPILLAEYLQEIGRAGRDGKSADALTLISEPTGWLDPGDQKRMHQFRDRQCKNYQKSQQLLKVLPQRGNIAAIAREYPHGAMTLSLLHHYHQLQWLDPLHYQLSTEPLLPPLNQFKKQQQKNSQPMVDYLMHRQCRWRFLIKAFGFSPKSPNFRCGHCDNCLG